MELVRIEEVASKPHESLNFKSEWGGSKLPGLHVLKPKGTARLKDQGEGKRGRLEGRSEGTDEPLTQQNCAKRPRTEPEDKEDRKASQEQEREVILVRRTLEVSKVTVKPQSEALGDRKEVKPKTFTQLRLEEVLSKKGSWSPPPGSRNEEDMEVGGRKGASKTKRKASGSPKEAGKSPRSQKSPQTRHKVRKVVADRGKSKESQPERPSGNLTPIRRRLREEGLVRKNLKRLEKSHRTADNNKTTLDNLTPDKDKTKTNRKKV